MSEKYKDKFEFYEDTFNIKKERVQELINDISKEVIDRTLRNERKNEYVIESIYQIGKTEDERLFLAFFMGGVMQIMSATNKIAMLVDTMIKRNMRDISLYQQMPDAFFSEMSENVGVPDFEMIYRKDNQIFDKMNEVIDKISEILSEDEDKNEY